MSNLREFTKGFWRENAAMVLLLGSNIVISLIAGFIPKKVRIPSYIVVIATLVTIVDMFMAAYSPDLHAALGLFIPLIVVNCIILGRAEAFASRSPLGASILDALGMGLGFTVTLFALGAVREILGNGTVTFFEYNETTLRFLFFEHEAVSPILVLILAPGAFITLGFFIAAKNYIDTARQSKCSNK